MHSSGALNLNKSNLQFKELKVSMKLLLDNK